MIIDGHTHIGLEDFLAIPIPDEKLRFPAFKDRMSNTVENLINKMDQNGVAKAIAFGFPLEEIDRYKANNYVIEAWQRFPDRIVPFMLVGDDTEYWIEKGARGFKQQDILYKSERFDLIRAYNVMAEASLPMLIHFRAHRDYSVTEQAIKILANVPKLTLIVAHMGRNMPNTGDKVKDAVSGLADYANVVFETSTVRDTATIEFAVKVVGEQRVIFGSDYPFNSVTDADPLAKEIDIINSLNLSDEVKTRIFSGNIRTLLSL